ncbi:MAG: MCE family protein [Actinobacteria bacterium]|nr:MCE family protein [Actinomycetota bacterium]
MMLERNQAVIGFIVGALILAATAFAVGMSGGMFKPGEELEAVFTDAAGLGTGDFVVVAGIRVGEVLSVEIDGDVARARFTLQSGGVPKDSTASIIIRNTLGKRAIRLEPGNDTEYLAAGDVIPLERTSTPVDLPELGDRSAELLGELNVEALQGLITAVADVTEGNREDVTQLLDGLDKVTKIIADKREELGQLIDRSEVLIDAAASKDQEIVRIIDAFGSTLDTLADRRSDIQRLLSETAAASNITADLIEDRRSQLDRILFELNEDLAIIDAHQVDLAHAFAYSGVGVYGFASIGYADGPAQRDTTGWGNVFVTGLGELGIQAAFGCGGALDEALTQVIGPDPTCEGEPDTVGTVEEDEDEGGAGSAATPTVPDPLEAPEVYGGIDRLFQLPDAEGDR